MSTAAPKIMLIDANAVIHRAYHALPPLTSPKGEMVNAVYGFASTLLKAIKDEKPNYIVVCYDAGRHTFRNDIYDGYKATRQETDEALALQIPRTKDLVTALSMPLYAQQGVEADDLIGSLTKIAAKKGLHSVVVTGDNDSLQLINDSTTVYKLRKGVTDTQVYHRDDVKEYLGVYPDQVVDYKALAGDSSDNIPGIPGFGPKTASQLLSKYQTIEGIYGHLDELPERQARLLTENKDSMAMSRVLGAIKLDLDIELDLDKAATENFDFSQAVGFFQELGFKSLLNRLPDSQPQHQASLFTGSAKAEAVEFKPKLPYQAIDSLAAWQALKLKLEKVDGLVIDTETTDLTGPLIGIAIAWTNTDSAYIPVGPVYPGGLPLKTLIDELGPILADPDVKKIGHNLKYDLHVLLKAGFKVEGVWFDTMIASGLINSQAFTHKLDDIALSELNFQKISITELIGKTKQVSMAEVELDKLAAYSCEDALITWRLYEHFQPDLETHHLKKIFYEIEMPLMSVLVKMEARGIEIDPDHLKKLGIRLHQRLDQIQAEAQKLAGQEFNLNSPAQLKEILFDKLQLSVKGIKRVKTGLSTNIETLMTLKDEHPIIPLILEHREVAKLLNTYVDTLPELADERHRLHTSFQQLGAATGRLASTNPNLQNIPIRTELGNEVRRAFVAGEGKVLVGADYSQAELRILAHLSDDQGLIKAFHDGDDFHASVGAELGVDRRTAKAINFGIVYGLGPSALANDLGIATQEAKQFIDRYFTTFPGVVKYIEAMKLKARTDGYVETLFGRRRYLPDIQSPNAGLRSAAERMAVNMPAQGSVADLMKKSMITIDAELPDGAAMLLQIHDELLFEVEKSQLATAGKVIRQAMMNVTELKVPLVVDLKSGPNWAELKSLSA